MATEFDLNILPLHRLNGRDQAGLPGVYNAAPPRRPARGRKNDHLVAYLHIEGPVTLSREQYNQLLDGMGQAFYKIPGTLTSALREVIEGLNDVLLNRNLRAGGQQIAGYLTLIVKKEDHLFMAQCGPMHGFLITAGDVEHIYDPHTSGRGLGVSRTPAIKFSQFPLAPGTLLTLVPKLPVGWNETTLNSTMGERLIAAGRRFMADAGSDMRALVIESLPGDGRVNLLRAPSALQSAPPPDMAQGQPAAKPAPRPAAPPQPKLETKTEEPVGSWEAVEQISSEPEDQPAITTSPVNPGGTVQAAPLRPPREEEPQTRRGPDLAALLASTGERMGQFTQSFSAAGRRLLVRILPGEELFTIPTYAMVIMAIAVPLVVVAAAAAVYINVGRDAQYNYYMQEARSAVTLAQDTGDDTQAYQAWEAALYYLDQAELYQVTDETEALRDTVQETIDEYDGIVRIELRPALIGTLGNLAKVRRMVANGTDVYMLDVNKGQVVRAILAGSGYEIDLNFDCAPGPYGSIIVGPLVDMAPLPSTNEDNATILAMDANGNLLYCIPGEPALAVPLIPPDSAWGEPKAMVIDSGNLYILDPLTNAVWIYFGEDSQFRESPRFFFTTTVPALGEAIDIAVNGEDLFVLLASGQVTHCIFNTLPEAPTRCEDPAVFTDPRPGKEDGPQVEGARFFQLIRTAPPEPSLFFLDPISRSVFHFSMRLNLTRQYRPQTDFQEGLATAFAVSPTRQLFVALDNQVFVGFIP